MTRIPRPTKHSHSRWLVVALLWLAACSADPVQFADGSSSDWSHWDERWILVNYWAEWCAPCRHEIPELNSMHRDRARSGIVVLGVNFDGLNGVDLAELSREMEIEFPVLDEDPRQRWGYERPTVLPTTIIVGPEGRLRATLVGPQTVETLEAAITNTPSGGS